MRACLIINPVSGDATPNDQKLGRIRELLAPAQFELEVATTSPERPATELATDAIAGGAEVLIVGGGDGTVSEVARVCLHEPVTLGILPIGTFNNMARSLGISVELAEACGVITEGHVREIDAGLALRSGETAGEYFFEAAGSGLDATLFPLGEEIKGGRWVRILQAMRLAFQYRPQHFELEFDRNLRDALPPERVRHMRRRHLATNRVRLRALFVAVANGPYYGSGFTVASGARLSDGRLTVSVYQRFSKWELLRHFQSISHGRYHYSPKIEVFHAREVRLSSPRSVPVHVDGRPLGCTPYIFRAVPRALRVYAPVKQDGAKKDPAVALPAAARAGTETAAAT